VSAQSKSAKSAQAEKRRLKLEEIRRAQRAKERRRRILIGGSILAVVVIVGVVIVSVVASGSNDPKAAATPVAQQIIPATPVGETTVQQKPTVVPDTSGISGALAWDTDGWPGDGSAHPGALEHAHVTGPVTYAVVPPVGGPHNAIWMNAGVYTKPVPSERAVHNLEHGAVWITYDPNLPAKEVAQLTSFVTRQSMIPESAQASGVANQANRYMDLTPWATNSLPSPIVISSWGHQLRVTSPTDPRLQAFVDKFRHNPTFTPEYGAAVDGIPIETGGRPALDGSAQPNPPGTAN
jgi:Protein of unknown function (DUF3105)